MSPRGGVRKGAGRPKLEGEKRTESLAGVHVTPTQLESYRTAARLADMTLTQWVTYLLDLEASAAVRTMSGRIYGYELGGSWRGAARSWLQHKRTTKGIHGDMIRWGDPNARFELGADAIEELASEVAAAAMNEHGEEIAHLKRKLQSVESELAELRMAANAPDDFVIMSRRRWKEMLAAERAADKKTA